MRTQVLALGIIGLCWPSLACDETRRHLIHIDSPAAPTSGSGGSPVNHPSHVDAGAVGGSGGTAGDLGVGGSVATLDATVAPLVCLPIPSKPWAAMANPSSLGVGNLYNPPVQAVDEDITKRWSTGIGQTGGEWIEVDFGATVTLTRVELDHAAHRDDLTAKADWPRGYTVSMSDTTRDFGAPQLAFGEGTTGFTNIIFQKPGTGRYLLIQQTQVDPDFWWSIHELYAKCEF